MDGYDKLITRCNIKKIYKAPPSLKESHVSDKLANNIDGIREVALCDGKRVDIVSDTEIVEVKRYIIRLGAIVQVLYYGKSFPGKYMRIHLFEHHGKRDDTFEELCDELNISVTYE